MRKEFSKFDEYGNAQMPDPQADQTACRIIEKALGNFLDCASCQKQKKLFDSGSAEDILKSHWLKTTRNW